ncbi:hypothetical protein DCW30_35550 [Streptomyces alfalfae]|uniref:Uncharacterized protein n=1 Tax=Streptomyces alfalfae TaxID=1642299 RepID=A0ABM6H2A3_9ACTN|nr:hypothetical protein A7J05_35115 [Streptomyces alfalfae]AYA20660.1 hypothetical protein D3X13_34455 [Streptomyces fradiae]RXX34867.1 hypothetical protein DCW30_35550 [Streptomyces alfalfae]RZM96134.1 hypothetical protein D4104_16115 [Streptomyces alfalfae]
MGDNQAGLPLAAEGAGRRRELAVDECSAVALADALTAAPWELVVGHDTEDDSPAADTAAAEEIGFFRTWRPLRAPRPPRRSFTGPTC